MDRGAWLATNHGVSRVGHNLVTSLPSLFVLILIPLKHITYVFHILAFLTKFM